MNISIQGKPLDGYVLVRVHIADDETPDNANIELWVKYDDSMNVLRENARTQLAIFLEQSLASCQNLEL